MKFVIETARDKYLVRDEARLRAKHADHIGKLIRVGSRLMVHEAAHEKRARVNHGEWLFDCECGSGVAAAPEFSAAYCFGCGAIHTHVVFPETDDRLNIEHILLARPRSENRNWEPTETLTALAIQNAEHKVVF
jgi:hypothetical protein